MESNISLQYQGSGTSDSDRKSIWLTLEQEPVPALDDMADLATAMGMLQSLTQLNSAVSQLAQDCTSASIDGNDVVVRINFYVWPSESNLKYWLSSNIGEIINTSPMTKNRSFDVIFNGTDLVEIPYLFTGTLTSLMPVYTTAGALSHATIELGEAEVIASEAIHTVYRANGVAKGFSHTVEMRFTKFAAGATSSISSVNCEISATYQNEDGETEVEILSIEIPQCAIDLLEWCEDEKPIGSSSCVGRDCDEEPILVVYYSTCEDDVVVSTEEVLNK